MPMKMKNTPLHDEHVSLKAVMAPFAGWDMPIHYGSILEEARHTRSSVSIFDVSHMGEFIVREKPEAPSLDHIVTAPVTRMKNKRCRYGFLLNQNGTIMDDLIAYRKADDEWMLVVNAATRERDFSFIKSQLSSSASIENISGGIVKIDVQGPGSPEVMRALAGDRIRDLAYYGFDFFDLLSGKFIISRTGYTGEPGYEIYIDAGIGVELWHSLMNNPAVRPAGLGARDILRLEMGYPLYGSELTENTTPIESGMERFLDMDKDFTGRDSLLVQQKRGAARRLIGFVSDGRRAPRHENRILADKREAGYVTSGVFSPHLNRGIGMGYIDADRSEEGREIRIDTGRGEITAQIVRVPFLKKGPIKMSEVV